MEKIIKINNDYNSLDKTLNILKKETPYECTITYDSWDIRTDELGKMEQCIIIKKSAMHGAKMYFQDDRFLKINYLIPNKMLNAYFGKSQKTHKNIIEIITGKISQALLSGSQKKAFEEIEQTVSKIVV